MAGSGLEELPDLVDFMEKFARTIYANGVKEISPMIHIVAPVEDVIINCPWDTDEEKWAVQEILRLKLEEVKATAYCVITEGWKVTYPEGVGLEDVHTRPSDDPRRIEVLFIAACARAGEKLLKEFAIKRGADGSVSELVANDSGVTSGTFLELFPQAIH